jgi:hypothetical protein
MQTNSVLIIISYKHLQSAPANQSQQQKASQIALDFGFCVATLGNIFSLEEQHNPKI